jgi:hypothetical protein
MAAMSEPTSVPEPEFPFRLLATNQYTACPALMDLELKLAAG